MRLFSHPIAALSLGLLLAAGQMQPPAQNDRSRRNQPDTVAIPMPPDRSADSYAIYSMLMPGEVFGKMAPETNKTWAIADTTVSYYDMNPRIDPRGQLKPPQDNAKAFNEAVGDYQTRRLERVELTQAPFRIDHPFQLLNSAQIIDLRAAKSNATASSEQQARWAGYPGITFFSEVYFDRQHDAALVYMNDWCAVFCAQGTWIYLEKHNNQWVQRSGITRAPASIPLSSTALPLELPVGFAL